MATLPSRLQAPPPGWAQHADVVVVGSGVAGLTTALHIHAAVPGCAVLLVTKALLDEGSTRWAQGGIAAALAPGDSPAEHLRDTVVAGVGLCNTAAVRVLVTEGPARVRELAALGAAFDRDFSGAFALTREGGHLRNRVAHAGGDATGYEVERALIAAVKAAPGIEVIEHALVLDLLTDSGGAVAGVVLHVLGEGSSDGVGAVHARAVVLATGGMGQVYASTTNPSVSTGDGVALALRAGAVVTDLEFVQFHPTALWLPEGETGRTGLVGQRRSGRTGHLAQIDQIDQLGQIGQIGQLPLVSEAMRGEGAVLVDAAGRRVMEGVHPLADLAPRDVVTKQMSRVMATHGVDHLYLDARGLGEETLAHRFPTITARCRAAGVDPAREPIPVAPAAHYASGGIRTDVYGRTSVPWLYACGEVACTGVHGANRLASNSLLEGLVFGPRIAADLARRLDSGLDSARRPPAGASVGASASAGAGAGTAAGVVAGGGSAALVDPARRAEMVQAMTDGAGVLRSAVSLRAVAKTLADAWVPGRPAVADQTRSSRFRGGAGEGTGAGEGAGFGTGSGEGTAVLAVAAGPRAWEATNLLTVATALATAAATREETRGSHWREDFVGTDDEHWRGHVLTRLDRGGTLGVTFEPADADGAPADGTGRAGWVAPWAEPGSESGAGAGAESGFGSGSGVEER